MARGGGKKRKRDSGAGLLTASFLPMLKKPASAVGKMAKVPGNYWHGATAAEKLKVFQCTVREFKAIHTFDAGRKGAGFEVQEMGEGGTGSLEPGVASGEVFVIPYPSPFLEFFYAANPEELPLERPHSGGEPAADAGATEEREGEEDGEQDAHAVENTSGDALVFKFITLVSDTLTAAGPKRGSRALKYKCNCSEACAASIVLICLA